MYKVCSPSTFHRRITTNISFPSYRPDLGLLIDVPFPDITTMAWQITIFFVMEDTFHYWAHRALHWGPLSIIFTKSIINTLLRSVLPLNTPTQLKFSFSVSEQLDPLYYSVQLLEISIYSRCIFGSLYGTFPLPVFVANGKLFRAIDAHSGYDFPWSLNKFIPFWAGADHHDFHHQAFVNNFSHEF